MKKISKMNGNELSVCMAKIAPCADAIFSDGAVSGAIDSLAAKMGKGIAADKAVAWFSGELFPLLTGEKHREDTYTIMEALGYGEASKMGEKNGIELLRDLFVIFVKDAEVTTIFRPGAEVRGE